MALSDITTHDVIEHDNSLFHTDYSSGKDPSYVNEEWVEELASFAQSDKSAVITEQHLIAFRKQRTAENVRSNSQTYVTWFFQQLCAGECALILNVLGHNRQIPVDHLKSFVIEQKIPDTYVRSPVVLNVTNEGFLATLNGVLEADQECADLVKISGKQQRKVSAYLLSSSDGH